MFAIYKREMKAYFTSPLGYIFAAVLMGVSGLLFCLTTIMENSTDTGLYFTFMLFVFIVLIPLLTMKLLSEERKMKTEQILLTSPVSLTGIISAKFFAAFTMFSSTLILSETINFSVLYNLAKAEKEATLSVISKLSVPTLIGNTLGILLVGSVCIAIGLMLSSLTENQLIAAVTTIGAMILLAVLSFLPNFIGNEILRVAVKWLSVFSRYYVLATGVFDLTAIIYFISLTVIFLFVTVRIYEKRRWD